MFRRIYVKATGVFWRCARERAVIKTLKQLRLGSCMSRAGEKRLRGTRKREREKQAAARSNCAIVSCHLDVCTTNCDDARDERGRRCIMCLGRTARSRERRDHPRTNATMKQSRNTDSSVLIDGGNTAIAFYVLDFNLRKRNAGTLIACSLITYIEV